MSWAWDDALEAFEEHLRHERDLSEHSVRGYLVDLRHLAEHARALGVTDPGALTTRTLRSHLANQQTRGRCPNFVRDLLLLLMRPAYEARALQVGRIGQHRSGLWGPGRRLPILLMYLWHWQAGRTLDFEIFVVTSTARGGRG